MNLCSECKKREAIIHTQTYDENGNEIMYCYPCAKKHGIDPLKSLGFNTDNMQSETLENYAKDAKNILNNNLNESSNVDTNSSNKNLNDFISNMNAKQLEDFTNANLDSLKDLDVHLKNLAKNIVDSIPPEEMDEKTSKTLDDLLDLIDANSKDLNKNNDSSVSNSGKHIMGFAIPFNEYLDDDKLKNMSFEDIKNFLLKHTSEDDDYFDEQGKFINGLDETQNTNSSSKASNNLKFLSKFGTNLNEKAKNGEIDNIVGRDKEINRVVEILNRRTKNNPCLIGEPGVGKTAIAQGLALKIVNKEVPVKLFEKEVYLLDLPSVVAGTQFRGQFEQRLEGIIKECTQNKNIILVIDEIHNLSGAGSGDHTMDAANILKPALADGSIQIIGTTTIDEYRKHIESDSALERRFQPVLIEEPSIDDTVKILEGIKGYYEKYHNVTISKDILRKIVIMSERYIHDRNLPDKAIDVLDEACSRINLKNADLAKLSILKEERDEAKNLKEENVSKDTSEGYDLAAKYRNQEIEYNKQIDELMPKIKPLVLTEEDVAKVIESWTKIPVQKITEQESKKLMNLENDLHKRVIGQDDAVKAVSRAIRRKRAGLQSTKRPPSFIFVGPTGVGKTELAKSLCYQMFGSEDNLIRIDMSEYMESNSVSKLIGAAPGYIGYDDAGQLTEKVKRHPYSVILFDEIEKAHSDVFNILLQVLDDGRLTDSKGDTINFQNTIIIMTSNAGSDLNLNSIGFGSSSEQKKDKMRQALQSTFRPEFLNRIDEIVYFDSLTDDDLLKIVDLMLSHVKKSLSEKNIKFQITKEAKEFLVKKGTDKKFGARPLRRAIERYVEDELSDLILSRKLVSRDTIKITLKNDNLDFKVVKPSKIVKSTKSL